MLEETGRQERGWQTRHVKVDGQVAENAAWSYDEAHEGLEGIDGYVAFRWHKMDHYPIAEIPKIKGLLSF